MHENKQNWTWVQTWQIFSNGKNWPVPEAKPRGKFFPAFFFLCQMKTETDIPTRKTMGFETFNDFSSEHKYRHEKIISILVLKIISIYSSAPRYCTALTRSTSLSGSVSEGKCFLTHSATRSFRSTLGPASLSPSPEDWTTRTDDRCSKTSLKKSARPPEPASTSHGMELFRERSTLWQKRRKRRIILLFLNFYSQSHQWQSTWNSDCTSSMLASPDTSIHRTGMSMLPLPEQIQTFSLPPVNFIYTDVT